MCITTVKKHAQLMEGVKTINGEILMGANTSKICLILNTCVSEKRGLVSRVHVRISESRRKRQRYTSVKSGRCAGRTNSFTVPYAFNLLKTKRDLLYISYQSVPRSKHFLPRL